MVFEGIEAYHQHFVMFASGLQYFQQSCVVVLVLYSDRIISYSVLIVDFHSLGMNWFVLIRC